MPAPTGAQIDLLETLYGRTHHGGPSFPAWRAQIERQGQWDVYSITNIITQLQRRVDAQNAGQWVDGHHLIDGTVYHVHPLRNAARARRYPEAREVHSLDLAHLTATGRASWRFRARAYVTQDRARFGRRLPAFSETTLVTAEGLAEFGAAHGFCAICGRTLTVTESVARGVGPVCWRRVGEYRERIAAATAAMAEIGEASPAAAVLDTPHGHAVGSRP